MVLIFNPLVSIKNVRSIAQIIYELLVLTYGSYDYRKRKNSIFYEIRTARKNCTKFFYQIFKYSSIKYLKYFLVLPVWIEYLQKDKSLRLPYNLSHWFRYKIYASLLYTKSRVIFDGDSPRFESSLTSSFYIPKQPKQTHIGTQAVHYVGIFNRAKPPARFAPRPLPLKRPKSTFFWYGMRNKSNEYKK